MKPAILLYLRFHEMALQDFFSILHLFSASFLVVVELWCFILFCFVLFDVRDHKEACFLFIISLFPCMSTIFLIPCDAHRSTLPEHYIS